MEVQTEASLKEPNQEQLYQLIDTFLTLLQNKREVDTLNTISNTFPPYALRVIERLMNTTSQGLVELIESEEFKEDRYSISLVDEETGENLILTNILNSEPQTPFFMIRATETHKTRDKSYNGFNAFEETHILGFFRKKSRSIAAHYSSEKHILNPTQKEPPTPNKLQQLYLI